MLEPWKHQPQTQKQTQETACIRKQLCYTLPPIVDGKNIFSVKAIPSTMKNYTCSQYAFEKTTGYAYVVYEKVLPKFFEQIAKPEPGSLAMYTVDENNRIPLHVGIVKTPQGVIVSKWGIEPYEIESALFSIPDIYRNTVSFFKLKSEYHGTPQHREYLKACMEHDFKTSSQEYLVNEWKNEIGFCKKLQN